MRSHSHLNTVRGILHAYDGSIPLASWMKGFFRSEKKYGSSDRRAIGHAVYCYYRIGNAFRDLTEEDRILTALFLCTGSEIRMLQELKPEWNGQIQLPLSDKLRLLHRGEEELNRIFPFGDHLSGAVEGDLFSASFLCQPDVFLRMRPGRSRAVRHQLRQADIPFQEETADTLRLPAQAKVEEILALNEEVVVQDINSQRVLDPLFSVVKRTPSSAWDCCAASGGKSLLLHDRFPEVRLTVSDVRESILINLEKRFRKAGIDHYTSFVADLTQPHFVPGKKFEVILCDAPCSGSGTWGRTPEQLRFFRPEQIGHYRNLQRRIMTGAVKALAPGGWLLYSTCSVFAEENESNVRYFEQELPLQLHESGYKKGYRMKADTLFTALFRAL